MVDNHNLTPLPTPFGEKLTMAVIEIPKIKWHFDFREVCDMSICKAGYHRCDVIFFVLPNEVGK